MSGGEKKSELLKKIVGRGQWKIEIRVPKKNSLQYFYNTFITSFTFQVVMGFYWWGNSYFSSRFKLEPIKNSHI